MSESSSSSDSSSSSGGSYDSGSASSSYDAGSSSYGDSYGSGASAYSDPYGAGAANPYATPYPGQPTSGTVGGYATGDIGYTQQPYPQPGHHDPYAQPYPYDQHGAYDQHSGAYVHKGSGHPGAHYPAAMPYQYGYGYGYPVAPVDESARTQSIVALVVNIMLVTFCCSPLGLAGAIVSGMAMSKAATDPPAARTLLKWGWGLAIATGVLWIGFFVVYLAVGVSTYETS